MPIMTDLDPAPDNMLKFIRCKCKNGLKCGDCRGETCNNSEQAIMDLEDPDEHEDIIMSRKTILNIFFHKYNLKARNLYSGARISEDFGYVNLQKIALLLIPKLSLYLFFLGSNAYLPH